MHLEKCSLNFSSSLFIISVNLLHPCPSSFFYGLILSLRCFSIFVKYHFQVSVNLKVILSIVEITQNTHGDVGPRSPLNNHKVRDQVSGPSIKFNQNRIIAHRKINQNRCGRSEMFQRKGRGQNPNSKRKRASNTVLYIPRKIMKYKSTSLSSCTVLSQVVTSFR